MKYKVEWFFFYYIYRTIYLLPQSIIECFHHLREKSSIFIRINLICPKPLPHLSIIHLYWVFGTHSCMASMTCPSATCGKQNSAMPWESGLCLGAQSPSSSVNLILHSSRYNSLHFPNLILWYLTVLLICVFLMLTVLSIFFHISDGSYVTSLDRCLFRCFANS